MHRNDTGINSIEELAILAAVGGKYETGKKGDVARRVLDFYSSPTFDRSVALAVIDDLKARGLIIQQLNGNVSLTPEGRRAVKAAAQYFSESVYHIVEFTRWNISLKET